MGKVGQFIFGGSSSKQKSQASSANQAYGYLRDVFGPITGQTAEGVNALQALLRGDSTGFDAYKSATGFDALADRGARGITSSAAARGLLRSGGTAKGLVNFGNQMQNQYANSYLDRVLQQAGLGLSAGSLISGAGNTSQSTSSGSSSQKPGITNFIGKALSGAAAG